MILVGAVMSRLLVSDLSQNYNFWRYCDTCKVTRMVTTLSEGIGSLARRCNQWCADPNPDLI